MSIHEPERHYGTDARHWSLSHRHKPHPETGPPKADIDELTPKESAQKAGMTGFKLSAEHSELITYGENMTSTGNQFTKAMAKPVGDPAASDKTGTVGMTRSLNTFITDKNWVELEKFHAAISTDTTNLTTFTTHMGDGFHAYGEVAMMASDKYSKADDHGHRHLGTIRFPDSKFAQDIQDGKKIYNDEYEGD